MKIKPPRLKVGDRIGVIAPSYPLSVVEPRHRLNGVAALSKLGYNIAFGKFTTIGSISNRQSARQRAEDFMNFVTDVSVSVIMSAIGGHGGHEILEYLDFKVIEKSPKIIIGYSDFTSIINSICEQSNIITFMGPAFVTFCTGDISDITVRSFTDVLSGSAACLQSQILDSSVWADDDWYLSKNTGRKWKANMGTYVYNHGTAVGSLWGGNVETFMPLLGTKYNGSLDGKIMLAEFSEASSFECIVEHLRELKTRGLIDQIAGLLIGRFNSKSLKGSFIECGELDEILHAGLGEVRIPIIGNLNFGHTEPLLTIPIGCKCRVSSSPPYVELLEYPVL